MNKSKKVVLVTVLVVVALTLAKFFSSEPVMAQTTTMKICSVFISGNWRDTVTVPSGWRTGTCLNYKNTVRATSYQVGCVFNNSYSFGAVGGGTPSPNCGW